MAIDKTARQYPEYQSNTLEHQSYWKDGLDITLNGTTKVDISEGTIHVVRSFDDFNNPGSYDVYVPEKLEWSLPHKAAGLPTTFFYYEFDTQTLIQQPSLIPAEFAHDFFLIGYLDHPNGSLVTDPYNISTVPNSEWVGELRRIMGFKVTGARLIPSLVDKNELVLTPGLSYYLSSNRKDLKNPSSYEIQGSLGDSAPLLYIWRDGTGGWLLNGTLGVIDTRYDNGTGGTPWPNGLVLDGKVTNQTFSICPLSSQTSANLTVCFCQFTQKAPYNSMQEAYIYAESGNAVLYPYYPATITVPRTRWTMVSQVPGPIDYKQKRHIDAWIIHIMVDPDRRFTREITPSEVTIATPAGNVVALEGDYIMTEVAEPSKQWVCRFADFDSRFEVA
jgi:hypothetical protein